MRNRDKILYIPGIPVHVQVLKIRKELFEADKYNRVWEEDGYVYFTEKNDKQ